MAAPLPLRRKLLYAAILSLFALAAGFGALELGLRVAGYGYSPHFARRVRLADGTAIWRDNRWCTAPFFTPALVRRPQPFRLPVAKPAGLIRIFVLGSSAAMGDPDASFSMGRMLAAMLRVAYPETRCEVVNAAITAINSHVDRGIAADCAELSPDLFIVYEGHNEVIGPFGPSGVFAPFLRSEAAVRAAVWLRGTRTGQLLAELGRRLRGQSGLPADWGGMQMFLRQQITADDPRLAGMRAHFRANLAAIATSARRAGAATLACTVLTNDRDFAPFLSRHRAGLSADELARWDAAVAAGDAAERAHDAAGAERAYRTALAIDDSYADLVFRLGRVALERDRDDDARRLLARARDLDTLRFRTDSALNDVVRDLGRRDPSIGVVDLAHDLAAASAHGLVGDELLYEHVHLTFHGAYEVARGLYPRVVAALQQRGQLPAGAARAPFDEAEARLQLGYTVHEQTMIAQQLLARFRAAPFTGQSDDRLRVETWERRAAAGARILGREDATAALRELARLSLARAPDDWVLARNLGAMFVERHEPAEALPLLLRANAWIDDDIDTLVPLGWARRALGQTTEAAATFARARELDPHYPGLPGADATAR